MLRKLAELTSDEAGAQRVAWTDVWQRARAFLREQLRGLPVTIRTDAAGNQWARLPDGGGGVVIIGSHLDSVPDGGWLDGAENHAVSASHTTPLDVTPPSESPSALLRQPVWRHRS